jgi:hypothetical protein
MVFVWSLVVLIGVVLMVLGPVLIVTKQMVLAGIVLEVIGVLTTFRGLLARSSRTSRGG